MRTMLRLSSAATLLMVGCATGPHQQAEQGRDGTRAYYVKIEASEPGVKIEADGEYLGEAPLEIKIWGDPDGTFHNFGSYRYVIRALPARPGQFEQTKVFRTGGWFTPEDRIPSRVYFDMSKQPPPVSTQQPSIIVVPTGPAPSVQLAQPDSGFAPGKHYIKAILKRGELLQLDDNSIWEIAPLSRVDAIIWLKLDDVVVIEGEDPRFPYRIINGEDVADAKLLSK